ncbi:hypothetical protein OTERR_11220 [Oryzomicrobium terrae]|uniref:Uncharacterized protein n=1 Tax=Oryzomicrobium terrae TaxID=1735038 RepID=A0A5C1E8P5_9RHOO|nr:hypothetical protein [Oryzomicrobium terrae]QEL64598.1 hypothetical protein OTERR_11220 [Oryzomicrobium terrae]
MKTMSRILTLGAVLLACSASAFAVTLIKEDEARLPAAAGGLTTRGITRGPGVKLLSPDPAAGAVKSPFAFKVAFEPRGGAKIDPATVSVTYLKATPVDLLPRVKPGLSAGGIDLSGAEVPPGEHQIRVTVQDSEGRQTSTVLQLNVAK